MEWTIENCVARAKREILADIADGTVPATVASFSELHDYVDANGYGGAFEVEGLGDESKGEGLYSEAQMDFWSDVQEQVDGWLKGGRL